MSFKQAVKCFTWSVLFLGTMAGTAEAQWSCASGRITRTLQLLRSHELIHRVPKTNYYRLNKKRQTVMMTALQFRITDLALLGLEKLC